MLTFSVTDQTIRRTDDRTTKLVSGSQEIYLAEFTFDSSWDGYSRVAVFYGVNKIVPVTLDNGTCIIPWEVLVAKSNLRIGAYGVNGNKRKTTIWTAVEFIQEGSYVEGAAPTPPTISEYERVLNIMQAQSVEAQRAITAQTASETASDDSMDSAAAALASAMLAKQQADNAAISAGAALTNANQAGGYSAAAQQANEAIQLTLQEMLDIEEAIRTSELNVNDDAHTVVLAKTDAEAARDRAEAAKLTLESARDAAAQSAIQAAESERQAKLSEGQSATSAIEADKSAGDAEESAITAANNILNGVSTHNNDEASHFDIRENADRIESIARGRATSLAFDTVEQLDAWIAGTYVRTDGKTIADLLIGDNLYIRDVNVPDYWWDGTQKQVLEAEAPALVDYYTKLQVEMLLPLTITRSDYDALYTSGQIQADRLYDIIEDDAV